MCGAQGTGETLDQAVAYTQTVVLGAPGMLLVYAANGIFRGLQKVRITLAAAVCGAVLNTMLDVLFVFGFGWGIAGSGAATMIAQWFMGLFLTVPAVLWAKADALRCDHACRASPPPEGMACRYSSAHSPFAPHGDGRSPRRPDWERQCWRGSRR